MRHLKEALSVLKSKETQFSGGNICVSSCGNYLLSIYGASVNVIDIKTGETVNKLDTEEEEITCILLSPDDQHLITAHRNLLLKQWKSWKLNNDDNDLDRKLERLNLKEDPSDSKSAGQCVRTWKAIHTAPIQCMAFDVTSSLLATGSSDFTTKVWDIHGQYCTHNLKGAQGIITHIRFHPLIYDNSLCATGSEDGKIRVYNLRTSQLEFTLDAHYSAITCFEFLNDSLDHLKYDRLISSSRDKCIIVWDLEERKQLRTMPAHESVESLILLPKLICDSNERVIQRVDQHFVTMGSEGLLKLWNLQSGKCLIQQNEKHSLKINKARQSKELTDISPCIVQGIYNAKTKMAVSLTVDQLVSFVRINEPVVEGEKSEQPLFNIYKQFVGSHGEILDMTLINRSETLLALATNSEFIKVYNLDTWDCQLLKGHTDLVLCLSSYAPKDEKQSKMNNDDDDEEQAKPDTKVSYLASSSKDSTIRVWRFVEKLNAEKSGYSYTYECLATCQGHTQDVGAICFANMDFSFLVSGSIDTTLKCWKISELDGNQLQLKCAFTLKAHEKDINSVCVSPNDKLIASGSSDRTAKIYNAADGTFLAALKGHKRGIWSIRFSPVDQIVATSSADATIKLWSLGDFSCYKTFEGHNTSVLKVNFINNGTQLVSTASDGLLKLWNIKTNECVSTFDEHTDKIWALCVSKDESRYLTGGADGKLIVWKDVTDEKNEEELEKREEILLKEQELNNYLIDKKWKKALGLAILLDKPYKCYEIIKQILQQEVKENEQKGKQDLERTLLKLRDDQIRSLIKYAVDWNTNTKFCHLAQTLFELVLRNYPPEFFTDAGGVDSETTVNASKLVQQFMPYSERHYSRLNRLVQQLMFIDYAWSNMKLNELN